MSAIYLYLDAEAGGAGSATGLETVARPHVRVLMRPDAFDRVANPGFEVDATGWSASAGVNGAGASVTRVTTDAHAGSACGQVVTAATAGSGAHYDLGTDRYWEEAAYGTAYAATVWLKRVSGPRRARLVLGSEGTASDRATLVIAELADEWEQYRVVWHPTASRTDAQLAIETDVAQALTVLVDDASVTQLDAMSQVENGSMLADATGWSVAAGINAAGTSATATTTGGMAEGGGYLTLVTTATDGSGCHFDLGSRRFVAGRTYRARVGLRMPGDVRLRLGSLGTAADRGDATVTSTGSWAWHHVDWTPTDDRTDAELAVTNASASALTVQVSAVEVYEAIDEVEGDGGRADVDELSWARSDSAAGTFAATLHDPADTRRYTPWAASGPLAGLLRPGLRLWARATFGQSLLPVAFGTVRRWVPDASAGTCQALGEDPMADLAAARVSVGFADDRSYRDCRARLFGAAAQAAGIDPVAGSARTDLTHADTEQATLYDGTAGPVSALDYLQALCDATGTVHHVAPSALAERLWRYSTVGRADHADATAAATSLSGDQLASVAGMESSDDATETTESVAWQAYERLVPAGTTLARARDPGSYADVDADDPYLHFVVDAAGVDEGVPEPTYEREVVWRRRRVRGSRRRIRVRTYRHRRVYPDAFVPFALDAGAERAWDMSFSVPVAIDGVTAEHPSATPATVSWSQATPRDASFRAVAPAASTTASVTVTGAAWMPLGEEAYERTDAAAAARSGLRSGPVTGTPYVGSLAAAEGLARYRLWRYGEGRLRPTLRVDHGLSHATALGVGVASHLGVDAERYSLSSAALVVRGVSGSVSGGGLLWSWDWSCEGLPDGAGTTFVLDSSALDGSDVLAA